MAPSEQVALRSTWIKAGARSMAHMRHAVTHERADTPALRWGRLVHMAVLEPHKLGNLPVWREGRRAGKAWDAFADAVGSGDYCTADEMGDLFQISAATREPLSHLPQIESTEVCVQWTDDEYGAATARIDALTARKSIIELKTTSRIDERAFISQAWSLGYQLQLGWYAHGVEVSTGAQPMAYILAVESSEPYCTAVYRVNADVLSSGYEEARKIAVAYRRCERAGRWPGPYDGQTLNFSAPAWARADAEEVDISNGTMEAAEL